MNRHPLLFIIIASLVIGVFPAVHAQTLVFPALSTDNTFTGANTFSVGVGLGPVAYSGLATLPATTNIIYCSDCQQTNPCTASGTGAFAQYISSTWNCARSSVPTLPIYLNTGTVLSLGNECNSIVTDSSGSTSTVTAVAALRSIDASGVAHDVACVVTSDNVQASNVGSLVFPYITAFSTNSAASQAGRGVIESSGTSPLRMVFTNNSGTSRKNTILWRDCLPGDGVGYGCGTDWTMGVDLTNLQGEDFSWMNGTSIKSLYFTGNCPSGCILYYGGFTGSITNIALSTNVLTVTVPNAFVTNAHVYIYGVTTSTYLNGQTVTVATASPTQFTASFTHADDLSHADTGTAAEVGVKQFLISDGHTDAQNNPEFGLVNGHLSHSTSARNLDNWNTATCSSNTATVTFDASFTNNSYIVMLTDQTTAGGARVSTKNAGSFVITCTGASDSVDYLVLGQPY